MQAPDLPTGRIARLEGYGMRSAADSYLYRPTSIPEVESLFHEAKDSGRQVILRGAGRSYGDANIARESIAIDFQRMRRILSWDPIEGVLECEAGATIEDLWRYCLEDGYWPPVVSGTMYPTLGGALGMNIHGKNNFRVGTIGEHVLEMDVLFPNGSLRTLGPTSDLFYAVISSAGLLGAITRVKMKMKHVDTGELDVLATSPRNWHEQIATFEEFEPNADYMVSWIDCFGRGFESGRGQFHGAWYRHSNAGFSQTLRPDAQDLPDTIMGLFPKSVVWRFLKVLNNRTGMRFVNWARDKAAAVVAANKTHPQSLVAFSFLLDYVPNWRKAYLPGGFIQYQSFVPKEHAADVFAGQVAMQQEAKLESFLGVMKRHRKDRYLFTHAVDGYSLALDFKVTIGNWHRLEALCHRMNDLVLQAGGRFYFAKDSTLRPSDVQAFLGDSALGQYRGLKKILDPDNLLTSDFAKRVGLDPASRV